MRNLKWTSVIVVLGLGLIVSSSALARRGLRQRGEQEKEGRRSGMKALDLTEEQREEMKEMWEGRSDDREKAVKQMSEKVDALAEVMKADDPDADAIRKAAQEVTELRTEHAMARHQVRKKMQNILTDEQKAKIKERREEMRKKRKEKMEEMRSRRKEKRSTRNKEKQKKSRSANKGKKTRSKTAGRRREMTQEREKLQEARENFRSVMRDVDSSDDDIRKAGKKLGDTLAESCVVMAKQVAQLADEVDDDAAEKIRARYEKRVEHRRKMIDRFLQRMESAGPRRK